MRMGLQRHRFLRRGRLRYFVAVAMLPVLLWCLGLLFVRLQPAYFDRLSAYAQTMSMKAMNRAVDECFRDEDVEYADFIHLIRDEQGQIHALESNSNAINRLKSAVSEKVQQSLEEESEKTIQIPVGSALSNPMFSALGYKIPVKVLPASYTQVQLRDEFVSVGINQVKHTLYLDVSTTVTVTTATSRKSETIETSVLVGDTVIVGRVPNYYGSGIVYTGEKDE